MLYVLGDRTESEEDASSLRKGDNLSRRKSDINRRKSDLIRRRLTDKTDSHTKVKSDRRESVMRYKKGKCKSLNVCALVSCHCKT